MRAHQKPYVLYLLTALTVLAAIAVIHYGGPFFAPGPKNITPDNNAVNMPNQTSPPSAGIDLTDNQLHVVTTEEAKTHSFTFEKEEVGSVAFQEKEAGASTGGARESAKSVIANVLESDSPLIKVGQPVHMKALVYPDRVFEGEVSALGVTLYDSGGNPALDPATHRIAVRCTIADPENRLYPGMLATITFQVQPPMDAVALPEKGVVREGDGTMTAWVTTDRHHFTQRTIETGLHQDGFYQILSGLQPGELVVTDGALFLDNALTSTSP